MSLAIRLQLLSGKYALIGGRMLSFAWANGCEAGLAGDHMYSDAARRMLSIGFLAIGLILERWDRS